MSINTRADDVFMVKEKSQEVQKKDKTDKNRENWKSWASYHRQQNRKKQMLRLKPRVTYDDDNIFSGSPCNNAL